MMNRKILGCLTAGLIVLNGCGQAAPTSVPATQGVPATSPPIAVAPTPTATQGIPAAAGAAVDFSDPASVVAAIFAAAQSQDFSQLAGLCDPLKQNDNDTQMICDLATDETERGSFTDAFATGKVAGPATISSEGADQVAEVPIVFGPDGSQQETVKLVQRDGKWFLSGF